VAGCPLGLKKKCIDLGVAGKHCSCLPKDVEVPVKVAGKCFLHVCIMLCVSVSSFLFCILKCCLLLLCVAHDRKSSWHIKPC